MPRFNRERRGWFFRRRHPERRGFSARIRHYWRWAKRLAVLGILIIVVGAWYLRHLDRLIEDKFDQPRKWNLPSKVFSDAEYLFPGVDVKVRDIVGKLDRLGYRDVGVTIERPGDYAKDADHLDVYLHDFDYPGEAFKGFPVRLRLSGSIIREMTRFRMKESLSMVRLEPEVVAPIFDERMEDRTVVTLEQVPPQLLEAIILLEDERFFRHHGVDPIGIVRAMFANVRVMRIVQGGSTLTQQLVKNFFLHPRKSLLRKINEALMAIEIERHHSKGEILQAYLNEIYLGQRGVSSVSGVAEAAKFYFAKNVNQLSLAECALLAGLIRSPNEYSPFRSLEGAKARRDLVLDKMREAELMTDQEYVMALAEPINPPKRMIRVVTAPFFLDYVKQELANLYSQEVLEAEGLRIFTTLDMRSQLSAEAAVDEEIPRLEHEAVSLLSADHAGQLQTCLIAVTPSNGYIRAMVGGRSYAESQFNRCTQALRQPGSTMKPFIYLTALDPSRSQTAMTPASLIEDRRFSVEAGGEEWSPENYDGKEHGMVTIRAALEESLNIATSRVAMAAGLEQVVQTARDAGVTSPLLAVPSLALGTFEVTPLELVSAYAIFPNGGIRAESIAITSVVTKDGDVLERRRISVQRKFAAGPVYVTTHLLQGVVDRGTAASIRAFGYQGFVAGKTGTTSNYRDAWFVGFNPELLALAWVGYDDNAEMKKITGARAALPLWLHFFRVVSPRSPQDFPRPKGVVLVEVDRHTGGLARRSCPETIDEAFLEDTEPTQACDEMTIDESATSF
ncbi:MAG: PBP1A family penicillin-binding protein [Deltaproteobacteria bacterium]|nr:PBP1A family penicillin-binding protein [Deltaproteobacteria bacterium]